MFLKKYFVIEQVGLKKRLHVSQKNLNDGSKWFKKGLILGNKGNYDPNNCYLGGVIPTAGVHAANFCDGVPNRKWRWK